jgi:hypothetical protein
MHSEANQARTKEVRAKEVRAKDFLRVARTVQESLHDPAVHRALAELIHAQDDPNVQDAMLAALRYPVAARVLEELEALMAAEG